MSTGVRPDAGDARQRGGRSYTTEQHQAVVRVMKCSSTAYYEILAVEKTCTDSQVKKAYRKLALVMHPDKNSAPQADEAFKRVSKAFQVLSDPDKKRVYDQTGSDPESRQAGFSGFNRGGARYQQAEFDPNDLFNMFFGGGAPGGGFGQSPFGQFGGPGGPQVFSFGGNTFQFGGAPFQQPGQRARQQAQNGAGGQEPPNWTQYVPFIGILIIMLLVQLFGGDSSSGSSAAKMPRFSFDQAAPYTQSRYTPNYNLQYFVNPREVKNTAASALRKLDRYAETTRIKNLRHQCEIEYDKRERALREASGWFSRDEDAYQTAVNMEMPACERLSDMGLGFSHH